MADQGDGLTLQAWLSPDPGVAAEAAGRLVQLSRRDARAAAMQRATTGAPKADGLSCMASVRSALRAAVPGELRMRDLREITGQRKNVISSCLAKLRGSGLIEDSGERYGRSYKWRGDGQSE